VKEFEKDLNDLTERLCLGEEKFVCNEMYRLRDRLIALHESNLVKINHSAMELVCAKYLVHAGYFVEIERILDGLSCDVYATKGLGSMIVEVETGFVPPENALNPSTYTKARIASKITRYSGYAEKFGLATPSHYVMPVPQVLIEPPRSRRDDEILAVKKLCDMYYSNPPVSLDEIRNARIHTVYILDVDNGTVKETEPTTYMERAEHLTF